MSGRARRTYRVKSLRISIPAKDRKRIVREIRRFLASPKGRMDLKRALMQAAESARKFRENSVVDWKELSKA